MPPKVNEEVVRLRKERRVIAEVASGILAGDVPLNNEAGGPRYKAVCSLLLIATRHPINVDLIKGVVEMIQYNDRVAGTLLSEVASHDYKELIRRAKRPI